jgi:hypothetical protein
MKYGILARNTTVANCTIVGNKMAGVYCGARNSSVTNSILWANNGGEDQLEWYSSACIPVVTYSNVEGGWADVGNMDCDPCFVEPGSWEPPVEPIPTATNPNPSAGSIQIDPNITLTWVPGEGAVSHDVYFGTGFDDVNNAKWNSDEFMGNYDSNSWDTNNFDPCGLAISTTYYWRIDEVGVSVAKGDVWSFTTFDPNLVGWWQFDEGEGPYAFDSSGYGNTARLISRVFWAPGLGDGSAVEFDNGRVVVEDGGSAGELRPMHEVTVSVWVHISIPQDSAARIVVKGVDNRETFDLEVYPYADNTFQFLVREDGTEDSLPRYGVVGGALVSDEWIHVTGTYDGSELRIYSNGQVRDSWHIGSIVLSQDVGDLGIGNAADVPRPFYGMIDDVRIYDRALSAEEILQIYESSASEASWSMVQYGGDYHLKPESRCIDTGSNDEIPADMTDLDGDGDSTEACPWDLDGEMRIVDGNNDGNSAVDMGAYEFFVPPVEVDLKFTPQALNITSKGKSVKAHMTFPRGYLPDDVDMETPLTIRPLGIECYDMRLSWTGNGTIRIEADFYRSDFCGGSAGNWPEEYDVVVEGVLKSGQPFRGTNGIKIIDKTMEQLEILASYWLEDECGPPDWCGGLDLDRNSVVNFADFASINACCIEVIEK